MPINRPLDPRNPVKRVEAMRIGGEKIHRDRVIEVYNPAPDAAVQEAIKSFTNVKTYSLPWS